MTQQMTWWSVEMNDGRTESLLALKIVVSLCNSSQYVGGCRLLRTNLDDYDSIQRSVGQNNHGEIIMFLNSVYTES